jgi:hypothetical protein
VERREGVVRGRRGERGRDRGKVVREQGDHTIPTKRLEATAPTFLSKGLAWRRNEWTTLLTCSAPASRASSASSAEGLAPDPDVSSDWLALEPLPVPVPLDGRAGELAHSPMSTSPSLTMIMEQSTSRAMSSISLLRCVS